MIVSEEQVLEQFFNFKKRFFFAGIIISKIYMLTQPNL